MGIKTLGSIKSLILEQAIECLRNFLGEKTIRGFQMSPSTYLLII